MDTQPITAVSSIEAEDGDLLIEGPRESLIAVYEAVCANEVIASQIKTAFLFGPNEDGLYALVLGGSHVSQ